MKFLVIGLGSMGKRRIRCLKALGHEDITGLDPREDRRVETEEKYGVNVVADVSDVGVYDALIISTPPDMHRQYIEAAIEYSKPAFVEASVVLDGLKESEKNAKEKGVLIAPSCTLRFHPAIRVISEIVKSESYGKFTNFSYHSGQYLPDWHPWETVADFYVSNPCTGGCREIVPFELTWLVDVFGFPRSISGHKSSTMDVGADIDDTYAMSMIFEQGVGCLLVDVVSRSAVRRMVLNMERAQIIWNWQEPFIHIYDVDSSKWNTQSISLGQAAEGYNASIIEDMYIDEVAAFIDGATGKVPYPNTFEDDIKVLELLEEVEKSNA